MTRYYKVIKDHPMWEVGAILSNELDEDKYEPVNDIWQKTLDHGKELGGSWYEGAELVENNREFFQRVYKVNILKQVKYLSKDKAKEIHDKLHKEDK